ncbi:MAG: hypothetical protein CMC96_04760 [Flavobacteriales bacterium]|nr:hypothetical protein [Flavobacteriales bacterium]|tara:strand:+ start:6500 stop:7135 length:636 start_codon:yes stop_codon:yes gene_type:complete
MREIWHKVGLLVVAVFCTIGIHAQHFEEELRLALKEDPKFEFKLDSRNAFISNTGVRVFGFKLGLNFDEKLSFGLGYNQLWSRPKNQLYLEGVNYNAEVNFYYFSPYVEYTFYRDEKWEFSIPVQFGLGESWYEFERNGNKLSRSRNFVMSYEPAITVQYTFLKYLGLGAGVGYRLMIVPNHSIEEQFTSPVYIFKFKIFFQEIYQDLVRE